MNFNLKEGIKSIINEKVDENMTAKNFGSGEIEVLATPVMIGFMEHASLQAVDPNLPEGYATVGYSLDVRHLSPTPVGMKVEVKSELVKIEEKKLTFKVTAYDEEEKIGEGEHIRFIVEVDQLQNKAENKSRT